MHLWDNFGLYVFKPRVALFKESPFCKEKVYVSIIAVLWNVGPPMLEGSFDPLRSITDHCTWNNELREHELRLRFLCLLVVQDSSFHHVLRE